eukprot:11437231-Alexandrium_andersonii.AAC.1
MGVLDDQEAHVCQVQVGWAPISPTIPLTQGTPPEDTEWDAGQADALCQAAEQDLMEEHEALDQHAEAWPSVEAVSYTHLTLPTICSV